VVASSHLADAEIGPLATMDIVDPMLAPAYFARMGTVIASSARSNGQV
jgi:hypothetical protein